MSLIKEIYSTYSGSLTDNQKDQLYKVLKSYPAEDLVTMEDHRLYIEVLAKLRQSLLRGFQLMGKNFLQMLESLLSVGEDGVYSNNQRFIYELIQNVDDCEYEDTTDCHLDVHFRYSRNPGTITFTYNEKGFTPANVFAITGIAEASKNISAGKVEIGEKGIGFKSVFGIADKVLIQSGMFSFALYRDNFTVPVPCYDGFTPVKGTQLTLEMPEAACRSTYRSLVDQYANGGDAILNKNPILFLNRLTHLKMYFDSFRYLEFNVRRIQPEYRDGLQIEPGVAVSVDMEDPQYIHRPQKKTVYCTRYTMPIVYGEAECKARYGADAGFSERQHYLIAVFPALTGEFRNFKGMLYSFLPTRIETTVPILLHVPYKLDGSREYVHSQGNNAWFTYTNERLSAFLRMVYLDFARRMKQKVIQYIPGSQNYFFKNDNGSADCLCVPALRGDQICKERVFLTEDGAFHSVDEIISFGKDEKIQDPPYVFGLLGYQSGLFIPPISVDMKRYGAKTIEWVPSALFRRGLQTDRLFDEILNWLEKNCEDLNYLKLLEEFEPITLTATHVLAIVNHPKLVQAFLERAKDRIARKASLGCTLDNSVPELGGDIPDTIREQVRITDLKPAFEAYLNQIGYGFRAVKADANFVLAAENGIVLALGHAFGSFSRLSSKFDPRGTFSASLKIRQASYELNRLDDAISNDEYLKRLRDVRGSLKTAFGDRMYKSYISIIQEAGTDKNRFLSELLQNADDCVYPEGITPSFNLMRMGQTLKIWYNEQGFTKDNVRAITAIGDSTKKLLLSGKDKSIGEKGVGFKSVFGVAKSVEIHSNGFDFVLTDQLPTIPNKCEPLADNTGTTMVFQMKQDVSGSFSVKRILQLCICLRNLKNLHVDNHTIVISDEGSKRIISVDGQQQLFERVVHPFVVADPAALKERNANGRRAGPAQQIVCYIPARIKGLRMAVYVGLPTAINSNVPLIIDAPFELTTSRENISCTIWNDIVREQVYCAILQVMESRSRTGLDVLRYVGFQSQNGVVSWGNFDDDYLNRFNWQKNLKDAKILPLLGREQRVSVNESSSRCVLIPEFIARLQKMLDVASCFAGRVIDMQGKSQYVPLLENIGCKKVSGSEILVFLRNHTEDLITNKDFRDGLYGYLSNNQGNAVFEGIGNGVLQLPIFPVKISGGTEYIAYSDEIYTHESALSKDGFYILDTSILPLDLADKILAKRGRINKLTQDVFDKKYQDFIIDCIDNPRQEYSAKKIASDLLGEFKNNREAFTKCKPVLMGLQSKIPFLMADGTYKRGNKYLNSCDQWYAGELVLSLIVDPAYQELGRFLELPEIQSLHFYEIDTDIKKLSDDDIEDLECGFTDYYGIIVGAIEAGWITDDQIAKYGLEFGVGRTGDEDDPDEKFPEKKVPNMAALRRHTKQQWEKQPNPYVEKTYIQWKPRYAVDKSSYVLSMYTSANNPNKCFCQMCKKILKIRYVERNSVERNPAFAWKEMYLNLCLNCSKDYMALRHNDVIWKAFINSIMAVNPLDAGLFEIPIGENTITFTATHLAEIQEIFKVEGWGINAPKRKAVLGASVDDEEEQEQIQLPWKEPAPSGKKVEAAGQKAAAASPVPIADFFNLRGFETVDMRPKGGAFWVIGERAEIKDIVEEASKLYHLTGGYSNGGKATRYRNGWFTKSKAK